MHVAIGSMTDGTIAQTIGNMPALLVAKVDGTLLLRMDLAPRRVVSIGRSPRCDLTLDSPAVSRRHALLFRHPGGWRIVDTGSRNGLHVEAGRTLAADLTELAWCRIGPAHLWLDPSEERTIGVERAASGSSGGQAIDPDELDLLDDPDREPGPVITLLDPRDRPLRRIALREHDGLLVGASTSCDLVVDDPRVAPLQAIFFREHSRWCVADAGDAAPLVVDGRRTRRQRLHGGLVLTLGEHRIVVSGPVRRPHELAEADSDPGLAGALADDAMALSGRRIDPGDTDVPDGGPVSAFLNDPS
ncbi:MAG: FHA domain-containing protein [Phycisphaerales bacterium]